MKRFFLLSLLSAAIFFTSCSGPMRIEKRRYNGGWYIASADHKKNTHTTTVPVVTRSEKKDSLVQPIAVMRTELPAAQIAPSPVMAAAAEKVAVAAPVAPKMKSPVMTAKKGNSITKNDQHAQKAMAHRSLLKRRDLDAAGDAVNTCTWLGTLVGVGIGLLAEESVLVIIAFGLVGLCGGFFIGLFVGLFALFA